MINSIRKLLSYFNIYLTRSPNLYYELIAEIRENLIKNSGGVLHIGAHRGLEAEFYASRDCDVIWVEAIPQVFETLISHISKYPKQRAIEALLGDKNKKKHLMYLSNNDFQSSSIFKFGKEMNHKNLIMETTITLPMKRLDELFSLKDLNKFKHWVVDVQGAELKVLKGAGKLLSNVNSMEIEVSTRDEYLGGAKWLEIKKYLESFHLYPLWLPKNKSHEDLIFIKRVIN